MEQPRSLQLIEEPPCIRINLMDKELHIHIVASEKPNRVSKMSKSYDLDRRWSQGIQNLPKPNLWGPT